MDKRVSDEIKRLGAKEIIVVGGKTSISDQVIKSLSVFDADKDVERISGTDRYETSEKVARKVMTIAKNSGKAVVASGEDFPDALTAGAFASREGYPILLARKNDIPNQIKRAITDLGIKETYIAGGYKMVSKSVEANLPKVIERLAGKNRYETSIEIAKSKFKNSTETFVASGEGFADALVISPIAGKYNASVLLVNKTDNNDKVKDYISNFGIDRITGVGGESSIPEKVLYGLIK
ncbi:MAG: cell wall-binding repeat-containing protein [Peptostreptococcus sp.]|uniref:cell wall-binding repeat-containing protein n=1 Tax=Peptostreptococcus sp. TaxID=1262 RepID=UPI0029004501|nr:cell wall-binding repeat-containing protein [Peptostreptococcus sp.]MDU1265298.1 cell wall-binding repeat-containing protein [Peptostreptococcus sp.]